MIITEFEQTEEHSVLPTEDLSMWPAHNLVFSFLVFPLLCPPRVYFASGPRSVTTIPGVHLINWLTQTAYVVRMLMHNSFYSMLTDTGKNYELHCTRIMWELHPHRNLWKKHWRGTNFSVPSGDKNSHRKSYNFKIFNIFIYSVFLKICLEFQDVINKVILGENIY
jgi:hypothetical protein